MYYSLSRRLQQPVHHSPADAAAVEGFGIDFRSALVVEFPQNPEQFSGDALLILPGSRALDQIRVIGVSGLIRTDHACPDSLCSACPIVCGINDPNRVDCADGTLAKQLRNLEESWPATVPVAPDAGAVPGPRTVISQTTTGNAMTGGTVTADEPATSDPKAGGDE